MTSDTRWNTVLQEILQPLLRQLGIQPGEAPVLEESRDYAPDFILAHFADSAGIIAPRLSAFRADSAVVSREGVVDLQTGRSRAFIPSHC